MLIHGLGLTKSGHIELFLLEENNLQAFRIYTILSFNASDLFLPLLTESGLCCLVFSSKIIRTILFERQKLCLFSA